MEALHQRILELESKLDAKQALELEIKQLEGSQRVMGENADVAKKIEALKEELEEKNEELESIDELNQTLINKERSSNDELQSARLELIRVSTYTHMLPFLFSFHFDHYQIREQLYTPHILI